MYERIVRQMAFMGRESPGTAVLSSALCKSSDRSFRWQSRYSKRRPLSYEPRVSCWVHHFSPILGEVGPSKSLQLAAQNFFGVILSVPIYGRNTSGMITLPSACW